MKVEEIYNIEQNNESEIFLVRDSKFWQAWEKSAFRFHKLFRPFKINFRYFKNISADMVYLGFPNTLLETIKLECADKGYSFDSVNDCVLKISKLPEISNFVEWKASAVSASTSKLSNVENKMRLDNRLASSTTDCNVPHNVLMLAYREVYDYALDVCKRSGKFFRNYRFGLGDRLRDESLEMLSMMQLVVQGVSVLEVSKMRELLYKARIELRLLLDLKQLNEKQWLFINGKIETILKLLRLESCRLHTSGENRSEFSNPLSP